LASRGWNENQAAIFGTAGAAPCDPLVGNLLSDLGVVFLGLAADFNAPVRSPIAQLIDPANAFHELWDIFELRPLIVCDADRNIYVYVFLDGGHDSLLRFTKVARHAACDLDSPQG
jgi:hypothetical protein